jgi:hypothetical protein
MKLTGSGAEKRRHRSVAKSTLFASVPRRVRPDVLAAAQERPGRPPIAALAAFDRGRPVRHQVTRSPDVPPPQPSP